jgi:putative hydrolase of HD superfamily
MPFLEFALKSLELKDIERTGWLVRKVRKPESVADHSFFLALLCSLYAKEEGIDELKCVRLALAHD